jgi:hypothetical protein
VVHPLQKKVQQEVMFNFINNSMLLNQGKKNREVKTASVQRTYSELVEFEESTLDSIYDNSH